MPVLSINGEPSEFTIVIAPIVKSLSVLIDALPNPPLNIPALAPIPAPVFPRIKFLLAFLKANLARFLYSSLFIDLWFLLLKS